MSATANGPRQVRDGNGPALMIIGWDGATPDLLERFVAEDKLPTVKRMIERGSYRPLRSTIPPVTACAWSSFLSGKNPGKHGLFDFVTPRGDGYSFDYTNGGYRKGQHGDFPAILNRAGLRVGCVNVPMTFPPPKIDGFVISGLDAPDEASGIGSPDELFKRAQAKTGAYRIDNRHLGAMTTDADRREAIEEFKRIETLRTDVTLAMIDGGDRPIDALIIVYNATDQVQHHFWHLMDDKHRCFPGHGSPEVRAFHDAIEEIYIHCDGELARLLESFPASDVMLMSDHGAGPTSGPRIRLNNALAQAGLLTFEKKRGGFGSELVGRLDRFLRRTLSAKQKARLARWLPGGRSRIEAMGLPPIDWGRTKAFVYEGFTLSPCVWINRAELFPDGTVESGQDYEDTCQAVIDALMSLKDPQTGEGAIHEVLRSRDVYHGDQLRTAPDLILNWWEGNTFTITRSHPRFADDPCVFYPPPKAIPGQDITGIHRRNGILVAAGANMAALDGRGQPADLIDIAPTTLALWNLPPAADMDGHVVEELLAGRIGHSAAPTSGADEPQTDTGTDDQDETTAYSDRERQMIEDRLSGLGYIE